MFQHVLSTKILSCMFKNKLKQSGNVIKTFHKFLRFANRTSWPNYVSLIKTNDFVGTFLIVCRHFVFFISYRLSCFLAACRRFEVRLKALSPRSNFSQPQSSIQVHCKLTMWRKYCIDLPDLLVVEIFSFVS